MARTEMDKTAVHQLACKRGDIITVTAISTTDGWHNQRHAILHKRFVLINDTKQSLPENDAFIYRNWVEVYLRPVDDSLVRKLGTESGMIRLSRCQIRIQKAQSKIDIPGYMSAREIMLDQINTEINSPEPETKVKGVIDGPQNNHDKNQWRSMHMSGYHVQARIPGQQWYKAGLATFRNPNPREFRIKPKDK